VLKRLVFLFQLKDLLLVGFVLSLGLFRAFNGGIGLRAQLCQFLQTAVSKWQLRKMCVDLFNSVYG